MTYFVTSSLTVFEAAIQVKSAHLIKSCLKIRKNMEIKEIVYMNLHLKYCVGMEFTAC